MQHKTIVYEPYLAGFVRVKHSPEEFIRKRKLEYIVIYSCSLYHRVFSRDPRLRYGYLEEVGTSPVQHAWGAHSQGRRVGIVHSLPPCLHARELDFTRIYVRQEGVEHADSVRTSTNACHHVLGEPSGQVQQLLAHEIQA